MKKPDESVSNLLQVLKNNIDTINTSMSCINNIYERLENHPQIKELIKKLPPQIK